MGIKENWIITLVGKNPLPSYYSILNYAENNTKAYIIYTEEGQEEAISSKNICENIKSAIRNKNKGVKILTKSCDKSNLKSIKNLCQEILNSILKECDYDNLGSDNIKITLDNTGGTKAMATILYNYFKDINVEGKHEKLRIYSSYMSSNKNEIYLSSLNPIKLEGCYIVNNIIDKFHITKEDLIKLHGYKIEEENESCVVVTKDNDQAIKINFNKIHIEDGNLRFYSTKSITKIKDLVNEYFLISDRIEKVGGTEALLTFTVKDYGFKGEKIEGRFDSFQESKETFYQQLNNVYSKDLKQKVKLIFENENI